MVLEDANTASGRVVTGTLRDETLKLLLLDAIELPTAEPLLGNVGAATTDEVGLELGRIFDDSTFTDEVSTSCEEGITDPPVERGTVSDVLPLEAPTVLEATAD